MLTLDEFRSEILAESAGKYTNEQVLIFYEIAKRFSDFAFKKWGDEKANVQKNAVIVEV